MTMAWGFDEQLAALGAVVRRFVRPLTLVPTTFAEPLRPFVLELCGWHKRTGRWPGLKDLRYFNHGSALDSVSEEAAQWAAPSFTENLVRASLVQFALDCGEAADQGRPEEWGNLPRGLDQALTAGRVEDPPPSREEALQQARKGGIGGGLVVGYGVAGLEAVEPLKPGLRGGEVAAVVATTGVGKSFWLVSQGISAVRSSVPVYHVSLELTRAETELRYMSGLLSQTTGELAQVQDEAFWSLAQELLPQDQVEVVHYPMRSVGWPLVASDCKKWLDRTGKKGLVVIDYPQLLRAGNEQRHSELKELYEDIVGFAQAEMVPVWTAHQSNRGGLDTGDVGLGNFAESYDATQPLHEILSLNQTLGEKAQQRMRLSFVKRRSAKTGVVPVGYDWSRLKIQELPA